VSHPSRILSLNEVRFMFDTLVGKLAGLKSRVGSSKDRLKAAAFRIPKHMILALVRYEAKAGRIELLVDTLRDLWLVSENELAPIFKERAAQAAWNLERAEARREAAGLSREPWDEAETAAWDFHGERSALYLVQENAAALGSFLAED
jgi:hypothetical protein